MVDLENSSFDPYEVLPPIELTKQRFVECVCVRVEVNNQFKHIILFYCTATIII